MLTNPVDSQWLILHNVDDTLPYAEGVGSLSAKPLWRVSWTDSIHIKTQNPSIQSSPMMMDCRCHSSPCPLGAWRWLAWSGEVLFRRIIDWILEGRYREEGAYCGRQRNSSLRRLFADSIPGSCVLPGNGAVTGWRLLMFSSLGLFLWGIQKESCFLNTG